MKLKHACEDGGQYGLNISPEEYSEEGVRLIRTSDITPGGLLDTEEGVFVPGPIEAKYVVKANDILLSRAGTIGRSFLVPRDGAESTFAGFLVRFRPRRDTDPRFLQYALQSLPVQEAIRRDAISSTIQNFNADRYSNLDLPDHGSVDQRRIADFLDDRVGRIDRIIAARREQVELATRAFRSLIDHLIVQSAEEVTQLRRFNALVQTGPFGSQLHSHEYVDDGWPVVNPASLINGRIVPLRGMSIEGTTRDRLARHVLQEDDIVFGRRGELGRAAMVTAEEVGWVCGTGSLLVRLADARLRPKFIAWVLGTSEVRHFFQLQSVGSTMDNLNTHILLSVPLRIPALAQQDALLEQLNDERTMAIRVGADLSDSIDLFTEYKSSLITAAVTGELDVTTAGSGIPA